jgi:hypothetical protein
MLTKLLLRFWFFGAMPKFFLGIGGGPSGDEKAMFKLLSSLGSFGTSKGMGAVSTGSKFFEDILSGDPTKMAAAIAPETKVIQERAEQRKKQAAEFGTRSGGTAATQANIDTDKIAAIQDLVNKLRPGAAQNLENVGLNLLSEGGSAASSGFTAASHIQAEEKARWDDIFKSIGDIGMAVAGI